MKHEPRLTVYTLKVKPKNATIENSNRWLIRNIIGELNIEDNIKDSYALAELFKKFISSLDKPEMYSDDRTKKCITANQLNIGDSTVNPNIVLHTQKSIIEGTIEGGSYGRKRNKTNTGNKSIKSDVNESDAITEDFYFMLYIPLQSNKMTLLLQSYSDDSIDTVMKKFWKNFLSSPPSFNQPTIKRFVPESIIKDFKDNSSVSSLQFSSNIPGETLLESTHQSSNRNYKVTVQIIPSDDKFSLKEFEEKNEHIQKAYFTRLMNLGQFSKKKGVLVDNSTGKTSPFDLGTNFEIQPSILLSKYISINFDESDFERIRAYCFNLLESIKSEIYIQNAVQER